MPSHRVLVPVGVAAALVGTAAFAAATTSSGTGAASSQYVYRGPVASASGGGGAPPAIPSIVNVRLGRAESALLSAATYVDQGDPGLASGPLLSARTNMRMAWKAAKYVVRTAPPPPVAGDGAYAHSSGGAPVGGYATPQDTVFAVLGLQHDVAATSAALMGSGNAALEADLTATIRSTVKAQDAAVAYVHTIAPPGPPAGDGGATSGGGAIAATWDTTMQQELPVLDDEIQTLRGARFVTPLLTTTKSFLKRMANRDRATQATINQYWPPIVGDG
jgi:hypothetical protein